MKALASSSSSSERNQQNAGAHSGLVHPLGVALNQPESAHSVEVSDEANGDRITAPEGRRGPSQSVLDSLADAETLRQQFSVSTFDPVVCAALSGGMTRYRIQDGDQVGAFRNAVLAARYAFRAVPGLR